MDTQLKTCSHSPISTGYSWGGAHVLAQVLTKKIILTTVPKKIQHLAYSIVGPVMKTKLQYFDVSVRSMGVCTSGVLGGSSSGFLYLMRFTP